MPRNTTDHKFKVGDIVEHAYGIGIILQIDCSYISREYDPKTVGVNWMFPKPLGYNPIRYFREKHPDFDIVLGITQLRKVSDAADHEK
jgi:hypothetical protein